VPRKTLSHRGSQFFWVGANAPGTVGGRKAHPPKVEKVWAWKQNTKEKRKAICSALSAVMMREKVMQRGHLIPQNYPFIISDDLEKITKTKQLVDALLKLGFKDELNRASEARTRAGKGKIRGRRKITRKSLLLVVSDTAAIGKAASNLPGIDVIHVKKLNAEALAPGGSPGRAALFTTKAIDELRKGWFTNKKMKTEDKKEGKEEKKVSKVSKVKKI
jgi:large subunit ribosomal protein L4e